MADASKSNGVPVMVAAGVKRKFQQIVVRLPVRPLLLGLLALLLFAGWPLLVAETKPVCGLAFSPDGKRLATLRGIPYDFLKPPMRFELAVWDVAAQKEDLVIPLDKPGWGMDFSPDGKTLAYGTQGGDIELYDAANGKCVRAWNTGAEHSTNWLAFAGNSRLLVANGGMNDGPKLWDVETGKQRAAAPEAAAGNCYSIQGALLVVGHWGGSTSVKTTWIYDLSRGQFEKVGTASETGYLSLGPDARLLAVEDRRRKVVRVIDLVTGQVMRTIDRSPATEMTFSPVASILAMRKHDSATASQIVELWDLSNNGKSQRAIFKAGRPPGGRLRDGLLSFTPDGASLAVGNEAGEVRICDVATMQVMAELPNVALLRWQTIAFGVLVLTWCAAWAAAGRRSEGRYAAWVDAATINLLIAAMLCLRMFGAGQAYYDPRRPVMWLAIAMLASWLMLAAIWTMFSVTRWPWRLAGFVFAVSLCWGVLLALLSGSLVPLFAIGTACVLAWWIMLFGVCRYAGFQLTPSGVTAQAAPPARQINLKDLLLWTAAVATLFSVVRLFQTDEISFARGTAILAYTGLLALAASIATCLGLSSARFSLRGGTALAGSLACGYAASLLSQGGLAMRKDWQVGFFVVFGCAIWGSLAVFRAHGFGLERNAERLQAILGTLRFACGTVRSVLATRIW